MVLDLTSGRLSDAIYHAQQALESVEARLTELQAGLDGTLPVEPEPAPQDDKKGKGKATGMRLKRDDLVQKMSKSQIEAEKKELEELKGDLAAKVRLWVLSALLEWAWVILTNYGTGRGAEDIAERNP